MTRRILLLRGVNVAGAKLPMAEFRAALERLGLTAVQSYIQSGNLVFDDPGLPDLAARIAQALQDGFGLTSELFLYTPHEIARIAAACPYGGDDGAKLHVFFLLRPCSLAVADLAPWISTEQLTITPRAIYLSAPDGIGRSKLAEKLARVVKVPMTARNWNTVQALLTLAG